MKIRLFAALRDKFGETIEISVSTPCTAQDVETALIGAGCWLPGTRIAIDHRFAFPDDEVNEGSELAALPPVTGG